MPDRRMTNRILRSRSSLVMLGVASAAAIACGGDSGSGPKNIDNLFWAVSNAPRASMIAVGGTYQLVTKPGNKDGKALDAPATVSYTMTDSSKVSVNASGIVKGLESTPYSPVGIVTTVVSGGVTHVDTAWVMVTDQVYHPKSLKIEPQDGPYGMIIFPKMITTTITDSYGTTLPYAFSSLSVPITSLSATDMMSQTVVSLSPTKSKVYGTVVAYGVTLSDSTAVSFNYLPFASLQFSLQYGKLSNPSAGYQVSVSVPGMVSVDNATDTALTIELKKSGGGADTTQVPANNSGLLMLSVGGTYTWTVISTWGKGMSGTIVARDNQ